MEAIAETLIGHIVDVEANGLTATLVEDEQGQTPKITIGDEDIAVGQVGSYVLIKQGDLQILSLLTRMVEQEKLSPIGSSEDTGEPIRIPYAQRTVFLTPVGSLNEDGEFERGVSTFPTTVPPAVGSAKL